MTRETVSLEGDEYTCAACGGDKTPLPNHLNSFSGDSQTVTSHQSTVTMRLLLLCTMVVVAISAQAEQVNQGSYCPTFQATLLVTLHYPVPVQDSEVSLQRIAREAGAYPNNLKRKLKKVKNQKKKSRRNKKNQGYKKPTKTGDKNSKIQGNKNRKIQGHKNRKIQGNKNQKNRGNKNRKNQGNKNKKIQGNKKQKNQGNKR